MRWYIKSAEQGYDQAQYRLSCQLDNGIGSVKDSLAALDWARKAAAQGNTAARLLIEEITSRQEP